MSMLWSLLACTVSIAAAAPVNTIDRQLGEKLAAVEAHLAGKRYLEAVKTAVAGFNLNASNCRGIEARPIYTRDPQGNEVVARTGFDQLVTLDPRQPTFNNARYLVSVLARELTHCDQNQALYTLAVSSDSRLERLGKVPLLRVAADLDDLASVATKESAAKAEALVKYKALAGKYGLELAPAQLTELTRRLADDFAAYKRSLAELHEMEAGLHAFEVPGVLPRPAPGQKASPEFAFHFRPLLASTSEFLRLRKLAGIPAEVYCKLANAVPMALVLQHERTCTEAMRFVADFFAAVPD